MKNRRDKQYFAMRALAAVMAPCALSLISPTYAAEMTNDKLLANLHREMAASGWDPAKPRGLGSAFGTYEHFVKVQNYVHFTSSASQKPDGDYVFGLVPSEVNIQGALEASRLSCLKAMNRLLHSVDGDLTKIRKIAVISHFTAMVDEFDNLDIIGNECSEMVLRIFGEEVGSHAKSIVAIPSFPHNLTHEVEFTVILHSDGEGTH